MEKFLLVEVPAQIKRKSKNDGPPFPHGLALRESLAITKEWGKIKERKKMGGMLC